MSEKTDKNANRIFEKIIPILKKIWVVMLLLSIVSIAYLFNSFVQATHSYHKCTLGNIGIEIKYRNAPEGTAYVDVLGKIDSSDENYTDFNVVPQNLIFRNDGAVVTDGDPLDIDENSEIARYNEDGYMSLSIHSKDFRYLDVNDDGSCRIVLNDSLKKFKLAYVGKHGEILGVTKKASHVCDPNEFDNITANGDKAVYSEDAEPLAFYAAVTTIVLTILLTVIVIIASTEEKESWDKWVEEQVQKASDNNGEV